MDSLPAHQLAYRYPPRDNSKRDRWVKGINRAHCSSSHCSPIKRCSYSCNAGFYGFEAQATGDFPYFDARRGKTNADFSAVIGISALFHPRYTNSFVSMRLNNPVSVYAGNYACVAAILQPRRFSKLSRMDALAAAEHYGVPIAPWKTIHDTAQAYLQGESFIPRLHQLQLLLAADERAIQEEQQPKKNPIKSLISKYSSVYDDDYYSPAVTF